MALNTSTTECMSTKNYCWIGHCVHTYRANKLLWPLLLSLLLLFFKDSWNIAPLKISFLCCYLIKNIIMPIIITFTTVARLDNMITYNILAFCTSNISYLTRTSIEYPPLLQLEHLCRFVICWNYFELSISSQDCSLSSVCDMTTTVLTEYFTNLSHHQRSNLF